MTGDSTVEDCSYDKFDNTVNKILEKKKINPIKLANHIPDTIMEKHDHFLPKELLDIGYAAMRFDIDTAWDWLIKIRGVEMKTKQETYCG